MEEEALELFDWTFVSRREQIVLECIDLRLLLDLHVVDQVLEVGQRDDLWTQLAIAEDDQKIDQINGASVGIENLVELAPAGIQFKVNELVHFRRSF